MHEFKFVRDDHTSPLQQHKLAQDLRRFEGGALWLEFVYEEQLQKVRDALQTTQTEDDDAALLAVTEAISTNGWTQESNQALVALVRIAHQHKMSVHALDMKEWSRDAFMRLHGSRGGWEYLNNRISSADDGLGATSRWSRLVMAEYVHRPSMVVVMGGALHGPILREILSESYGVEMEYMYDTMDELTLISDQESHRLRGVLSRLASV